MTTEKILGIDIGKSGRAVCCFLDHFPGNLKHWFLKNKDNPDAFFSISPSKESIEKLKGLGLTAIIMEPTGSHYSGFWAQFAKVQRIPVCWISHQELYGQRSHFGFRNKSDHEDALCLAASYFDPMFVGRFGDRRFLRHYDSDATKQLKQLVLEVEQLDAMRTAAVNQLRQRLAAEFPEASEKAWQRANSGHTPFLGWLGYGETNKRYEKLWEESAGKILGFDLTEYSEEHAKAIVDIEERITRHESRISRILDSSPFAPYQSVWTEFGFGLTMRSLFTLQVYPFDKFLVDGQPLIEYEMVDGKQSKRHRSMRSFQAYLGLSRRIEQSGDKTVQKFSGSSLCRSHLYAWFLCRIAINREGNQLKTEVGQKLRQKWEATRKANIKGKDGIIRCLFLATRLMFSELLKI